MTNQYPEIEKMTTPPIDAATLIKAAEPGSMIYARVTVAGKLQTAFLIRENRATIDTLGKTPSVVIVTGLLVEQSVHLVPALIQVDTIPVYECWFNFHQTDGGAKYFNDLSTQVDIPILFYSATKMIRSIAVPNHLGAMFANYTAGMPTQAWTMQDFDAARNRVYKRYPEVDDLWDALAGK